VKRNLFILLLLPFLSLAQELTTTVSRNPVAAGEQFQISFSANGEIEQFRAPNFNGLRILSGPNQSSSSSVQMINGQFSQSKTVSYNYYATALNEGSLEIGSASAKVDGKDVKSKPIKLIVGKANPKSENNVLDLSDKVFIKAHINKTKLYQGEQLVVSYKLYSKINLANIDITALPELNGFWKEEVETSSRPTVKAIDGVNHNVWEISRMIVTPQRSGILEIDPMQATITVQVKKNRKRNDPFRDPFGFFDSYQNIDENLQSANLKIEVLPLPNPPANFSGAVGEFKIDASVDKKEGKTNEAISYKLTLSGIGNLHLIDEIPIEFPNDFEVYDPQLTDKSFNSKNGISGKRIFEHLLIPRYQGTYTIPTVEFVYFNTKSKNYETLQTKSFDIKVSKGKGDEGSYRPAEELQESTNNRLHGIKKSASWQKKDNFDLLSSWWYWLVVLLPIIGVITFMIYQKWEEKNNINPVSRKLRKSLKTAQKRLKLANILLKKGEKELFFEEIEKSLWLYFADKFNVDIAILSKESIHSHFEKNGVQNKTTESFTQIIDDCEFCRFAPSSLDANQMQEVYEKATRVIIEVETDLKK
tara:strand:+ start:680 stop:2443 length:1764 start_codon:yes stop_codon:yes gene_type:complete